MAYTAQAPERAPQQDRQKLDERGLIEHIGQIVQDLETEARRRVSQKMALEKRWLEDLQAYHNKYDAETMANIEEAGGSKLFIGLTRTKTNALEARLYDMLFPTDDKNYGLRPTPVPELDGKAKDAVRLAQENVEQANIQQEAGNPQAAESLAARADEFAETARRLKAEMDEAKRRCQAMEDEIEDQLRESRYQSEAREAIRDACRIGTGVMKGPMVATKMRPRWKKRNSQGGAEVYELIPTTDPRPMYYRVNPWNFYPDMDIDTMDESTGEYERHLMSKRALRRLARQPGFYADAIRELLKEEPRMGPPQYRADLRSITDTTIDAGSDKYHVWEYHGPLEVEHIKVLIEALAEETMLQDMGLDGEDIDPLTEAIVTVWFCDGKLLKFGMHPMDSGESIYSVFALERDEATVFGFGLPYLIRDSQKALNGAWRMLMDNSGLSAGPQILINDALVEPVDGDYRLRPRKTWRYTGDPGNAKLPPFDTFDIPGNHEELIAVINLVKDNIDEEAAIPDYAQGEMGATPRETATGAAIIMNSANVMFRRIVRNWDDDMTTPNLRRLYDWNMQHSKKEHIKGDYEVDARGTSVLLVREIHAQNLMVLLFQGSVHPVLGPLTKVRDLYRKLAQSLMLPADDVVKSEEEVERELANTPPEPNPEMEKLTMQYNIAQLEAQTRMQLATMERDTAMMKLAAEQNMTVEQLRAKLDIARAEIAAKERGQAVEIAVEERNLRRGVAAPSGGTISVENNARKAH